jgi:hypothetical protein
MLKIGGPVQAALSTPKRINTSSTLFYTTRKRGLMSETEQVKELLRIERRRFQGGSVSDLVFFTLGVSALTVFAIFGIQLDNSLLIWAIVSLYFLAIFVGMLLLTIDVMRPSTIVVSIGGIVETVGGKLRNSILWGPDVRVKVEIDPITNKRQLMPLIGIEVFGGKGKIITVSVEDGWKYPDVRTLATTIAQLTGEIDIKMDGDLIAYSAQLANRNIDSPA